MPIALRSDGAELVAEVDRGRLMAHIETIAVGPRANVENHAAALAAADHADRAFTEAGLRPSRTDVSAVGVTLPVVWVEIPGSGCPAPAATPTYVLTAHYDTVPGSPGADDDASGVAAVLEIARILAGRPLRASVVLAVVPFEELGEQYPGAAALAELLVQDPGRSVQGMVSAEMLGYATQQPDSQGLPGDYLNLLAYEGSDELVADFRSAAAQWVPHFEVQAATFPADTAFINRSDNAAFQERGVPSAFASDGADFRTPYYHSEQDVPANISQEFLVDSARVLLAWLVLSAMREPTC